MNISKISKNYILCGYFEYHCLLCQETYHLISDLVRHMRWEKHRNSVKNHPLVPKFRKEFIAKIENSYYCTICNILLQDIEAVKTHTHKDEHKHQKSNPDTLKKPLIGKYNYDFIELMNKEIINFMIWNGVIGKKCVICNTLVENGAKHIKINDHVLKLIQTVIIEDNGNYYRKINDSIFQCFMCKKIFMNTLFAEHKKKHDKTNNNEGGKSKSESKNLNYKSEALVDLDGKIFLDLHKDLFFIDMENKEATCKVCDSVIHPVRKQFKTHLNIHYESKYKDGQKIKELHARIFKDHGKRRSEVAKYGQENYIMLNEGGRMGFCTLCDKRLSPHLGVFIEHVRGLCHTNHLKLKRKEYEKLEYKTVPLTKYIKSINFCKKIEMFRINTDHLIFDYSFLLIKEINFGSRANQMKCFACGEVYAVSDKYKHCKTVEHKQNFLAAKFIDNKEEIILREIRPNLYHCGLCNEVLPLSKTLERHLQSFRHVTLRYQTSTNLRPGIDAQQYYYQTMKFKSIPTNLTEDNMYSKIMKAVVNK